MPLGRGLLLVALAEPFHAAGRVDQLLLAGEEGVALAADLDPQLLLGGTGRPGLAAGAVDQDLVQLGVDAGLHGTRHSTDPGPAMQPPPGPPHPGPSGPSFRRERGPGGEGALESPSSRLLRAKRVLPVRHRTRHGRAKALA